MNRPLASRSLLRLLPLVLAVSATVAEAQEVRSYGSDTSGQISGTPTDWGYIDVGGGGQFSLALRANGTITGWGSNSYG